jgi:hypothetical protein
MEYKDKQYYNKQNGTHKEDKTKEEKRKKKDQTRLFKLKCELLKISTDL